MVLMSGGYRESSRSLDVPAFCEAFGLSVFQFSVFQFYPNPLFPASSPARSSPEGLHANSKPFAIGSRIPYPQPVYYS
jgi:hypothetical protein